MDPLVGPIAQVFGGVTVGAYFVYHLTSKWRESRNGGPPDRRTLNEIRDELKGIRSDLGKASEQNAEAHRLAGEALAVLRDRR